ncbi:hypothetical protein [Pseudomonas aeruginosa]|uniref:hypothetical protein n=1 Tax=Pseudomonas aeruginosa TaxID=287 RepID=UPI003D28E574
MSNIRNVQWNEGAPEKLQAGMLIEIIGKPIFLVGGPIDSPAFTHSFKKIKRWAWLIQPHELAWLEDMANKHKARARG